MLRKLKELMFGDGHSLQERMFAIITLMLVLSFTVYTVINTVTRGADRNILIRAGLLVLLVIIAVVSLKRQRIRMGSILMLSPKLSAFFSASRSIVPRQTVASPFAAQ